MLALLAAVRRRFILAPKVARLPETLSIAIDNVSGKRATFGAKMNRLRTAASNANTMRTNLSAAYSRITDTDVASETAALARNQVLQQAGSSMLAQANQAPQVALSLLRG